MATIMIVDDDPPKRYVARRYLERAGHAVLEAPCGRDVLEHGRVRADVFLLDVRLPDIDGYELCRRLKARGAADTVPVIHYSHVFTDAEHVRRSVDAGAERYLIKPDGDALVRAVQDMLGATPPPSPRERVQAFLAAHPGLPFCAPCIGGRVSLSTQLVREMAWILEQDRRFRFRSGECVECLRRRRVIEAVAPRAVVGAKPEIVAFLLENRGVRMCDACVAFGTRHSLTDCRRSIGELVGLPEFQGVEGRCDVCHRPARTVMALSAGVTGEFPALEAASLSDVGRTVAYRGWTIDLLSYRLARGWRPFVLIRGASMALVPDAPSLMMMVFDSRGEADDHALKRASEWIDTHLARDSGRPSPP